MCRVDEPLDWEYDEPEEGEPPYTLVGSVLFAALIVVGIGVWLVLR